jgi:hypothetical protein
MLPPHFPLEDALQINEAGLHLDGIEKIGPDGTVYFAEKNMAIFKQVLGYECTSLQLSDVEDWARELQAKYEAFAKGVGKVS